MEKIWSGFYKKNIDERLGVIEQADILSEEHLEFLKNNEVLDFDTANNMVENVIGTFSLPFSVVPNFTVDGKQYVVPFVTEEPSVVAACSNAGKIVAKSGGFKTEILDRKMIGHVALYDIADTAVAVERILQSKELLLKTANEAYPSIVARGGGACDIDVKVLSEEGVDFVVVYLIVDTLEAMGANMLNTILESLVSPIEAMTAGESIMAILSNLAINSVVTAKCVLSPRILDTKTTKGEEVRDRIVLASEFSKADPYRATTHNKGIMNGIDAVVIATGNDWRAIEAGAHAYTTLSGTYQPFSKWYTHDEKELVGILTIPMPIGTVGGSIAIHPAAQFSHELLMNPSAKELAAIIASIGLAQNFAALKALVTDGIQKGHMNLQVKSLALTAGATEEEIPQIIQLLKEQKHFNLETVQNILTTIRKR